MARRLTVFISSTSDLEKERDAVEEALLDLDIDGSRFESWPSISNEPIAECLQQLEQSEAIVLLLGDKYGSHSQDGISVTHLEYRHAKKLNRPVFSYVLERERREKEQNKFIEEVQKDFFRCQPIKSIDQLKKQVRNSLLNEFVKCFRKFHYVHQEKPPIDSDKSTNIEYYDRVKDSNQALELVEYLFSIGDNIGIHNFAIMKGDEYVKVPEIANFIYNSEVNLAMDGVGIEPQRIINAIEFWNSSVAKKRWHRASLHYNQGNAFGVLKRYNKAIESYKKSLNEASDEAFCWKNLGDAYRETNELSLARKCYEKALKNDPQLFEALYSIATLLIVHENDHGSAIIYLNRIALDSLSKARLSAVCVWKAIAYLNIGSYAEGITNAEDSIKIDPDIDSGWKIAGRLYALIRHQDSNWLHKCADFWERFVEKYPHIPEAWAEIGFTYWIIGNNGQDLLFVEKSLKGFKRSLFLGFEDNGLVWDRIGHLYDNVGKHIEAENAYRNAAQVNNKDFGYCLGICLMSKGEHTEALPFLQDAALHYQPDSLSWANVGSCHTHLGDIDKAITAFEKAIVLDPENSFAWYELGGVYWNKKEIEKALKIWEIATEKFPEHELFMQVGKILHHYNKLKY